MTIRLENKTTYDCHNPRHYNGQIEAVVMPKARKWLRVNRQGITRIVIELNKVVIKIPNFFYQWDHFLKGIIANINENRIWKWHPHRQLLCPVIWCSWGGWILIMRKVKILTDEEFIEHVDIHAYTEAGFDGDDKSDNYGWLEGKVVKIDYG